jgi:hypothetical protein
MFYKADGRISSRTRRIPGAPASCHFTDRRVHVRPDAAAARGKPLPLHHLIGLQASSQVTPDEQANLLGFQRRNEFPFEVAASNRIVRLELSNRAKFLNSEMPTALAIFHVGQWEQPM